MALLQESNTFLAGKTTLDHFRANLLAAAEIEAVPIFAARALPYGT